jgi:hypothetical protein
MSDIVKSGHGDNSPFCQLVYLVAWYESWDDLPDPAGIDAEAVRPIRDDIERRVRHLIDELGIDTDAVQHQPVS